MSQKTKIDICVPTYKRPSWLLDLLKSLSHQQGNFELRVIVVDNDSEGSARNAVDSFSKTAGFTLVYDVEPTQGLSFARNRLLSHVTADFFAFLDDDETAREDWLINLFQTMEKYGADAVFGPVLDILPEDAPEWSKHFFSGPAPKPTGTPLTFGATGNVLVRTKALGTPPQPFDPLYALTGGEDIDFFYRLHLSGKKLFWCQEAVATEMVPVERLNIAWVRRRSFRGGQSYVKTFVDRNHRVKKIGWCLVKSAQAFGGLLLLPFLRIVSYSAYVRLLGRVAGSFGQITGLWGDTFQYKEYEASRFRKSAP